MQRVIRGPRPPHKSREREREQEKVKAASEDMTPLNAKLSQRGHKSCHFTNESKKKVEIVLDKSVTLSKRGHQCNASFHPVKPVEWFQGESRYHIR